jgi:lipopolysaccharide/colanic/teichoic acid biosynthesis glycosyltransferase
MKLAGLGAAIVYLQFIVKRAFDIVTAALVLLVLSPLIFLTVLAIKLNSRGPIFSVSRRNCYNDQTVSLLRFRCHANWSPTTVGNVLVRTGIDRLPSLINVLRGDMSIVGPRCRVPAPSLPLAGHLLLALRKRPFRPGLVSFGEALKVNSERREIEADLFYVSHWSLLLDAKALILKFLSVTTYSQNYSHR